MKISLLYKKGFSLTELLAVILIMMIMTLVAVNSYSVMKQRRSLRSATDNINSAMTTARSYAISKNAWHRLVIQFQDNSSPAGVLKQGYWIDEIEPDSDTPALTNTIDDTVRAQVVPFQSLPDTVEITSATIQGVSQEFNIGTNPHFTNNYGVIRFRPNGTSDNAEVFAREISKSTPSGPLSARVRLYPSTAKSLVKAGAQ